jgi:phospholipase/carboxylesterase
MLAKNNSSVIYRQGIILRTNLPLSNPPDKVAILFHGWNGDENSMQIFFPDLPEDIAIIAPRAFHRTNEGGYTWARSLTSWSIIEENTRSPLPDLMDSVQRINQNLDSWLKYFSLEPREIFIAGFSQGGALALLLGLSYPLKYNRIACLSGYLPAGFELISSLQSLLTNKILITHGSQDEIIPVDNARATVQRLMASGLDVDYCEDNSRHKIGIHCRSKLAAFFKD